MRKTLFSGWLVGVFMFGFVLACDDGDDEASCGDWSCNGDETCANCPGDCGACPGTCGDGGCGAGENCSNCPGDCGACPGCTQALCAAGSTECCTGGAPGTWNAVLRLCVCPSSSCGNASCDSGEDCVNCPADCGACPGFCGDGFCESGRGENCSSCDRDCGACPYCGDWSCNGDETCSSCPDDCGACPCTSALCSSGSTLCCAGGLPGIWNAATSHCDCYSCTTYGDCGTEDICISGRCESAWGRAYRVTAVDATLPAGIDSDDSVPDCYITTWIDGTAYRSSTVDEDYTPTWNHSFDVSLNRTSSFTWTIYDWDPIDDDELTWRAPGETWVDVDWLRTGTVSFHDEAWSLVVTYEFDPR